MSQQAKTLALVFLLGTVSTAEAAQADLISFSQAGFVTSPTFSNVQTFSFAIDIAGPLVHGVYSNPALNSVVYSVSGTLTPGTPSGFPAFNLQRTITGADFYAQGSSLNFEIAGGADLSDGLQASELTGTDPVFVFNGREVGTGRYHPALFQLNSDGTGSIRNSNNMGGVNPSSGMVVDVQQGEEYITNLTFNPSQLTLASAVPEPSSLLLLSSAAIVGIAIGRRRSRA
ncbi:MAG: PEP-CTERM sorting domain-containing protein [Planctomycetaceae bacterium]